MKQNKNIVKGWAMFLEAYYPVFVGAFEGEKPPKNHLLKKELEKAGQKVFFEPCEIHLKAAKSKKKR